MLKELYVISHFQILLCYVYRSFITSTSQPFLETQSQLFKTNKRSSFSCEWEEFGTAKRGLCSRHNWAPFTPRFIIVINECSDESIKLKQSNTVFCRFETNPEMCKKWMRANSLMAPLFASTLYSWIFREKATNLLIYVHALYVLIVNEFA